LCFRLLRVENGHRIGLLVSDHAVTKAICQVRRVEAQQQIDMDAGDAKIGAKLHVANRQKGGNGPISWMSSRATSVIRREKVIAKQTVADC